MQDAARQVTNTTKEVTKTVEVAKEFTKSWTKDTSTSVTNRYLITEIGKK